MEDRHDQEERRVADVLAKFVRTSGRTRRDLEQELGLSSAGLSKILRGTVRLQLVHVLRILEALGVEPADFFSVAYPRVGGSKSRELVEEVRRIGGIGRESQEEFNLRVRQALLELLGAERTAS